MLKNRFWKKILSFNFQNKQKPSFNELELKKPLIIDSEETKKQIKEHFLEGDELKRKKVYDKAQEQYHKALGKAHQIKDYQNLLKGLQALGELYQERKEFIQAKMCYNSALNLLNDEKSKDKITNTGSDSNGTENNDKGLKHSYLG